MAEAAGRVCVITGASQGIGRGLALGLAQRGERVVVVGRDQGRGLQAQAEIRAATGNTQVDLLLADLSSGQQVQALARTVAERYPRVDVLINNHTAIFEQRTVSVDGLEMNFALNHLAYLHLTLRLLEPLRASPAARVINVAAEAHRQAAIDFDDLQAERAYDPVAVYCRAKLGNVLFTLELARRLQGTSITANCLHPGTVGTHALREIRAVHSRRTGKPLTDYPAPGPVEVGTATPLYLATAEAVRGVTGAYFVDQRPVPPSDEARDPETARRLWEISVGLCGLEALKL